MNQKLFSSVGITLLILFLASCSKSPLCWGDDKNKGLIVSEVNINLAGCLDQDNNTGKQYIIDSNEEYYSLTENSNYCDSSDLPYVDFGKYTLLGQYATGGCEVKFIREVSYNSETQEYLYSIIVRDCGACQSMRYDMNLVLVPKLPENSNVKFIIKE
ncbi:hypothetical protein LCGC14_1271400 [marine sediment metagenome]|uniref:Lipoprotein n=1 Tax=marine sediment metagenome TaxID=412755 RepID=A0A0F9KZT9_9ZZZZ